MDLKHLLNLQGTLLLEIYFEGKKSKIELSTKREYRGESKYSLWHNTIKWYGDRSKTTECTELFLAKNQVH